MAENGRLQPLLTKLLRGMPEVQVTTAKYLSELALAHIMKVVVAEQVGALLVIIIKTGGLPPREATLNVLSRCHLKNQAPTYCCFRQHTTASGWHPATARRLAAPWPGMAAMCLVQWRPAPWEKRNIGRGRG